jgi:hypothetical protein
MRSVFIRFVTEGDRIRGFPTLAKRARSSSLPGQVYQVPNESRGLLASEYISYCGGFAAAGTTGENA